MRPLTSFSTTMAAETCRAGALLLLSLTRAFNFLAHAMYAGRDEDELARERERKQRLIDKQMGAVLKTVPTVPPKPRRGDFNSAM